MKEGDHSVGLGLFVAQMGPEIQALQKRVEEEGLSDGFRLIGDSTPLGPSLCRSSLYIRPTRSDGDSVSVREALDAGIPVLASDVCDRPYGVTVYPYGDDRQLLAGVLSLLDGVENSPPIKTSAGEEAFQKILQMYRNTGVSNGR